MFTIAAFDNFDHDDKNTTSGLSSSHDTVLTLFQEKPDKIQSKPEKSKCNLKHITIPDKLPCQEILPYYQKSKCIEISETFSVEKELFISEKNKK